MPDNYYIVAELSWELQVQANTDLMDTNVFRIGNGPLKRRRLTCKISDSVLCCDQGSLKSFLIGLDY